MVRNQQLDEPSERTCGMTLPLSKLRAQSVALAIGNLNIENPHVTREAIARAAADFERIFGSDD
jgi:hypothetical protein